MGKAPSYHARTCLFSLCSCYTGELLFSDLPYTAVADAKEIVLGVLVRKRDSDISKPWIKNVFLAQTGVAQ